MNHVARIDMPQGTITGVMLRGRYAAWPVSKRPYYPSGRQEGFI
ncbi:MAG TPA: hypothetical protein VL527_06500 [Dongiaceae bacterium]|nr:hypothetical protein [Dongiaceae bacterium]